MIYTLIPCDNWAFCKADVPDGGLSSYDVGTVTATQTVENVYLHTECHAFECLTHCFQLSELKIGRAHV